MQQIFISYKSEEKTQMNKMLSILENAGFECWVAPRDIPIGSNYASEIPAAIDCCPVFILLLSEKAQASPWISKELSLAIGAKKEILPIMISDCQLTNEYKYYLTNVQVYSITEDTENGLQDILERIGFLLHKEVKKPEVQKTVTPAFRVSQKTEPKRRSLEPYIGDKPYIFMSYAHRDKEKADLIAKSLADAGFRLWYDIGIYSGSEWPEMIAECLDKSEVVVALVSKNYQQSHGCKAELNFAIHKNKKILTVILDDEPLNSVLSMQLSAHRFISYCSYPSNLEFIQAVSDLPLIAPCKE